MTDNEKDIPVTPDSDVAETSSELSSPTAADLVAVESNDEEDASVEKESKPFFKACAWVGALLALGAWIAMAFSGVVSFWLAVAGLVVSIFGVRCRHGLVRDMAITAIVAAAVLILVFAIFYGVLFYLDKAFAG